MNVADVCQRIMETEDRLRVNDIRYGTIHIWPVIRICLWYLYTSRSASKAYTSARTGMFLIKMLMGLFRKSFSGNFEMKGTHTDVMFFSTSSNSYTERDEHGCYNRIIDPVFELAAEKYKVCKINSLDNLQNGALSIPGQIVDFSKPTFRAYFMGLWALLSNASSFYSICKLHGVGSFDLGIRVVNYVALMLHSRRLFERLLSHCLPRLLLLDVYYSAVGAGAVLAARKHGIASVDLQHGKQGRYQAAYTHWSKIPQMGYQTLPDYFWLWGRESERNIMSFSPARKTHRCVIGGFPWLQKYQQSEHFGALPESIRLTLNNRNVVVFSLQAADPDLEQVFPTSVVQAMANYGESWIWLLRLHPNHKNLKATVLERIRGVSRNCYLIDGIDSLPLYALLKVANHHITAFSTVVYEAESFGVKTSLFGQNARSLYGSEIECGRFLYFSNSEELQAQMTGSLHGDNQQWTGEKYIETSHALARAAIDKLVALDEQRR